MTTRRHETVLRDEAVAALVTRSDGCYVDATFGRGGHTRALLSRLDATARVLVVDKDPEAIAVARQLAQEDARLQVEQGSFAELPALLHRAGLSQPLSGILLDLGVSSPQLDEPRRGFSFLRDGPLDMRMDPEQGESAADWIARASEKELVDVFKVYGEERFARRIARAIVAARAEAPVEGTARLASIIAQAHPAWEPGRHPATRCFQAIRIHINRELADLERALPAMSERLAPGGRLVVISFHSLEDRIVKRFIRDQSRGAQLPAYLPVTDDQLQRPLRAIGKSVRPSAEEVAANPRARSAVMRIAERRAP